MYSMTSNLHQDDVSLANSFSLNKIKAFLNCTVNCEFLFVIISMIVYCL